MKASNPCVLGRGALVAIDVWNIIDSHLKLALMVQNCNYLFNLPIKIIINKDE